MNPDATRSPRADAQRNRARLLAVALEAFSSGHAVTLESIARTAGVGIGTLYRHFPTRDALVEAVYRTELTRLCDGAPGLLSSAAPDAALRTWMSDYAEFVATKREMAAALRTLIASGAITSTQTRAQLGEAIGVLLAAGADDGSLRTDVDAGDVVAAMAGVLLAAASPAQRDRMLDLVMDSLRPRA